MKKIKNLISVITLALVMLMSFNVNAQEYVIKLTEDLEKVVLDPVKINKENPIHLSNELVESNSTMIDYLSKFNDGFVNSKKMSKQESLKVKEVYHSVIASAEKNQNFIDIMELVGKSKSINELRKSVKNEIKNAINVNRLKAFILFDYQIQIMDHHGALNMGNYSDGNKVSASDCCEAFWNGLWNVFKGAAAGATLGAVVGGSGCTVVLPIIGTVACGVVGSFVGATLGFFYTLFG